MTALKKFFKFFNGQAGVLDDGGHGKTIDGIMTGNG